MGATERLPLNSMTHEERMKLVEDNQGLVWHFVHKICRDEQLKEDCFMAGIGAYDLDRDGLPTAASGLMRASLYWDETRDAKFSVFAAFEIQCAIRDFLFYNREIRLPDAQRTGITSYYRKINQLENDQVEITSDILTETAKEFGLSAEVAERVINPSISVQQAVAFGDNDDARYLEDVIPASTNIDQAQENLEFQELLTFVVDAFENKTKQDPTYGDMLKEYFQEFIKKALGEESRTMLDIVKAKYPKYAILATDSKDEAKEKARLLDLEYCKLSNRWKQRQKVVQGLVREYLAAAL